MQSIILYRPRFVHSSYVRWSVLFVLWRFIQFKAILFKFFEKCIQFTTWCCFIEIFHFNNTSFKASLCKYLEYEKLSLIKIADIEWISNNILTTTTKKKGSTYTSKINVCCHIIWSIQLFCQWPFICIAFQNCAPCIMLNFGSEIPWGFFNN